MVYTDLCEQPINLFVIRTFLNSTFDFAVVNLQKINFSESAN